MSRFLGTRTNVIIFAAVSALVGAALAWWSPAFLRSLEMKVFDHYQTTVTAPPPPQKIIVVLATEKSIRAFRQWPLPRGVHAELLGKLGLAKIIAVDILFAETSAPDDDRLLAAVARQLGNVIFAVHLEPLPGGGRRLVLTYPELAAAAAEFGVVNVDVESDGIYRDCWALWEVDGGLLPSLSFAVFSALQTAAPELVETKGGHQLILPNAAPLPLKTDYSFKIQPAASAVEIYEYADVMDGSVPPETFKDAVVFVGVNASGASDFKLIGDGKIISGTEFNARATLTLSQGLIIADAPRLWAILGGAGLALGGALLGWWRKRRWSWLLALAGIGGWLTLGFVLFRYYQLWLPPLTAGAAGIGAYLLATLEQHRSKALAETLAREELFFGVIRMIMGAIDAKDPTTAGHSERVAALARELAAQLGMTKKETEDIYLTGLLHDVGKLGIPDAVLNKPGKFDDAEREIIRRHPRLGADLMREIKLPEHLIAGIVEHHERLDGKGYYNIPAPAQGAIGKIIKVADVYDALVSKRQYKDAMPPNVVLKILREGAGIEFDPALLAPFIATHFTPEIIAAADAANEKK